MRDIAATRRRNDSNHAPRRSLRRRLALWILLSTLTTLAVFATAVYVFLAAEIAEQARGESDATPMDDALEQLFNAMLAASPFCIVLSVGGALWLSRRALTPLGVVISEVRAMTVEDLKRRLPVPARVDELRDLTLTLNDLLARLDQGFDALASYASAASHELRTPIAVIESQLEVALRHTRSSEQWERVAHTSLDELHRLTQLITALLELARASSPTGTDHQATDLGDCIDQAVAGLATEAHAAGVVIDVQDPKTDVAIYVDASVAVLVSAIQELVRNALRHAPGSPVQISYQLHDPRAAEVHVDDRGHGVNAAERATIFEPLVRGSRSRDATHRAQGFGLGLSIVKRSIERCGGRMSVETSPAGGARFTLLLPAGRHMADRNAASD